LRRKEIIWKEEKRSSMRGEENCGMRKSIICNIRQITLRRKRALKIKVFNVTHTIEVRHACSTLARKPGATSDA
jgi:uncharacterized protein with von Willebrand factor type A (vWA) domain